MSAAEDLQRRTDARRAAYSAAQLLLDALGHLDHGDLTRFERALVAAHTTLAGPVGDLQARGGLT